MITTDGYREKSSDTIIFTCIIEKVTAIGTVTARGYRPAIGCNMYVYDHTLSRVGREGVFAKMKVVAFRINVRTFEITPNCCKFNEECEVTKMSLYERHFHILIVGRSKFTRIVDQQGKNAFTKINHARTFVVLRHSHALLNGTTSSGYTLFSVSNSFWCSPAA